MFESWMLFIKTLSVAQNLSIRHGGTVEEAMVLLNDIYTKMDMKEKVSIAFMNGVDDE